MSHQNLQRDFQRVDLVGLVLRIKTNTAHERYFEKGHRFNFKKIADIWLSLLKKIKAPPGTYLFYLHEIMNGIPAAKGLAFNKYSLHIKSYFWNPEEVKPFCGTLSAGFMNKEDFDCLYLTLKSFQEGVEKTFHQVKLEMSSPKPETVNDLSKIKDEELDLASIADTDIFEVYKLAKAQPKTTLCGTWVSYISKLYFLSGFEEKKSVKPYAAGKLYKDIAVEKVIHELTEKLAKKFIIVFSRNGAEKNFHFKDLLLSFLANPDTFDINILSDKYTLYFQEVIKIWKNKHIPKNRKHDWSVKKESEFKALSAYYYFSAEKELEFRELYFAIGYQELIQTHAAKIAQDAIKAEELRKLLEIEEGKQVANEACIKTVETLLDQQKKIGISIATGIKILKLQISNLSVE